MSKYKSLSDIDKKLMIQNMYLNKNMSFADIAEQCDTYPNKVRRDALKFGIQIRDKSEAQKNALTTGKHKHPTKGKEREANVKAKIGRAILNHWEGLSEDEISTIKKKAKDNWEKLSEDEKDNMKQNAQNAVRQSSKTGSKLEKYLLNKLLGAGWKVDFHKEQALSNTKLQIDLFLPTINTAIEIDGPSHFLPVWGEEALQKNIKYDNKKSGLILGRGMLLVRIKQVRDFSPSRAEIVFEKLNPVLLQIQQGLYKDQEKTITIEDE